jgi:hypothetical protein
MDDADPGAKEYPNANAHPVASGVSNVVGQVATAACQATDSVSALRDAVRRTPLVMSLVMLGLGYLVGIMLETRPRSRR